MSHRKSYQTLYWRNSQQQCLENRSKSRWWTQYGSIICFYCRKVGHLVKFCWNTPSYRNQQNRNNLFNELSPYTLHRSRIELNNINDKDNMETFFRRRMSEFENKCNEPSHTEVPRYKPKIATLDSRKWHQKLMKAQLRLRRLSMWFPKQTQHQQQKQQQQDPPQQHNSQQKQQQQQQKFQLGQQPNQQIRQPQQLQQ